MKKPNPSTEQQILGFALANYLADRRKKILSEWMTAIRQDKAVPAANELTTMQLKDHIPQILDELNQTLCDAFSAKVKEQAAWTAATHGYLRWQQHYDISQLILEFASLRRILICQLADFQEKGAINFDGKTGVFAMLVLHSFFDRLIRHSVDQYVHTQHVLKPPRRE